MAKVSIVTVTLNRESLKNACESVDRVLKIIIIMY